MAKPKRGVVVKTHHTGYHNVYAPRLTVKDAARVERIEGVRWADLADDMLMVHVNPCYDGADVLAEVKSYLEGRR